MSWPLVRDLAHTGPMDRPDGRLNAWILAWAGPTLFENPAGLFDAPAFHPLAGRARLLGEPAAAGGRRRSAAAAVRPRPRLQRRARSRSLLLSGLARAAPRAARERRPAGGLRGRRFLRGRPAPLDAPVAPARAGDRLPPARAPGARPLLGEPNAAPRARRGPDARAAGALVGVPRRDHRHGPGRRRAGGALRGASPARARAPRGRHAAGRRRAVARHRPLPAHARLPGTGVHARDGRDLRGHAAVLRRRGHRGLGAALAAPARPHDDPRHPLPGPVRAGARNRRSGLGAHALPRGRRGRFGRGRPVLARPRDGVLPLPPRAPGAGARRAGARPLRARAHAGARGARGPGARGSPPARRARGARR